MRRSVQAWNCVATQVVMGASGPVGCSYEGWRAALELHPDGLWTWEVFSDLRLFEAELLKYAHQRSKRHAGGGGMERALMDAYGDELEEELSDGAEDPD